MTKKNKKPNDGFTKSIMMDFVNPSSIKFAFFGTAELSVAVLEELEKAGHLPSLIVTGPDKRQGRGLKLTPLPVKIWAAARGIKVLQPTEFNTQILKDLSTKKWDVFVVFAFGALLPGELLQLPVRGVLNLHPSLLPRLRGPSPIRSTILNDERKTGISIILLDEEIDHGPIVAQKPIAIPDWPPKASELEKQLTQEGGALLAKILPEWVAGNIEAREQNHDVATYCEKIEKQDGLLDLSADPYANLLKIRAYEGWPGTYTFFERNGKKIRVQILDGHLEHEKLVIDRVKPEGKREMSYDEFRRSGAKIH